MSDALSKPTEAVEVEVEAVARAMAENAGFVWEYSAQNQWRSDAKAAIAALDAAREAAGMVTVPREPTEEMLSAGREAESDCLIWSLEPGEGLDDFDPEPAYRAMLAAASPAPKEG